ncbi:hypothetical protein INS49_000300 [Diaporthe citri]|uniref:uncharacterized protein n=1 Tax=Diaporthe citri TaxID=83186 RepID=UPI001C7F4282|nr:uncharacterized protein INS49_000300 [Diaporthe citri]KAG6366124.1 hypothetical protein INS49_000300 [Diaporthe citri]
MRRSFRHDLILLLIASDLTKSLWFVIYSSITLNHLLSTDSGSAFCQVSGFFFAMGIEASDAAVFLIALHWTVYIFRSNRAAGESGIYPYRYLAFTFYVLFPTLMASLAFFTRFPAYVDTGAAEPTFEFTETGHKLQPPRPSLSTLKLGGKVENLPSRQSPSQCRISFDFYRRPISTTMEEDDTSKGERLNVGRSRNLNGSQMHIYTVLQQGPSSEREGDPTPSTPIASLDYETLESDGISRSRDRIRRQLRLLFIYPAVYGCVWVFPLVSDVIGFHKDHNQRPFWILVASIVSLSVQGMADTIVFCLREKPWRHTKGGFWENLGIFVNGLSFDSRNEIGRTREEMFHDGSRARLRREEEMEREQRASRMSPGCTSQVYVSRNWWDVELHGDDEVESQDGKGKDEEWQGRVMRDDRGSMQTG